VELFALIYMTFFEKFVVCDNPYCPESEVVSSTLKTNQCVKLQGRSASHGRENSATGMLCCAGAVLTLSHIEYTPLLIRTLKSNGEETGKE
jgi:hypothetical protein